MGNFSRNPRSRLDDAAAKHYVGVRMQQGVPLLDADWNELEDLRRLESENLGRLFLGDGVPVGGNGFQIVPLAGGGVNTIVLTAHMTPGAGFSAIQVRTAESTAAAALGFEEKNSAAGRKGDFPAMVTGNLTEPFILTDGLTLSVQVDELPVETIVFAAADFADIGAATAAEVVAAIAAISANFTAAAGGGNDFLIRGGSAAGPGLLLVEGRLAVNESDLLYSQQPLYRNSALAAAWGVPPAAALSAPPGNTAFMVYLDVWHREVDSREDRLLMDERVGIETAVRLRREWVVRVCAEAEYIIVYRDRPVGHGYYPLALVRRTALQGAISGDMLSDLRATDLALRRQIAYFGTREIVLVDTQAFTELLTATRENVRDFIVYLTTRFVQPDDAYCAAEVAGIDALSTVAHVADQGLALLVAHSLGTREALTFLGQLQQAEARWVQVWTDALLPLDKPGGKIYNTAFAGMIARVDGYLAGPAPASFMTLPEALARGDLHQAVRSQQRINLEIGRELSRSTGYLVVTYLGSTSATVTRNATLDLRYGIQGIVTPADAMGVEVFIDPQWSVQLRNRDGSTPLALSMGAGEDEEEFIVSVTSPNVPVAETTVSVRAYAQSNEVGLARNSIQKTLTIGQPTPPSEEDFAIGIYSSNLSYIEGVYEFVPSITVAAFGFRFANNTSAPVRVDIAYSPDLPPSGWQISPPAPSSLTDVTINARDDVVLGFGFRRPAAHGSTLAFGLHVTLHGTATVVGDAGIRIQATAP
ncbi:MAG: hypothetical protein WAU91_04965 [Desulfatitalea sp.]